MAQLCDNTCTGLLPKIGMSRPADLQNLNVENPPQAQNERIDQSPAAVRRRRVRYFRRADGWFNRFVRLAGVVHEGFWLGCLSADDLNAITAEHYAHSHESASPEHNLRGFFDWEPGGGAASLSSGFAHSRSSRGGRTGSSGTAPHGLPG